MTSDPAGRFQILDSRIACWRFSEAATVATFEEAFEEFNQIIRRPEITRLLVIVHESDTSWGQDIQKVWLETGNVLDQIGIGKWGVVAPQDIKSLLIQFLVSGGREQGRNYDYLVSKSEADVLAWLRT